MSKKVLTEEEKKRVTRHIDEAIESIKKEQQDGETVKGRKTRDTNRRR